MDHLHPSGKLVREVVGDRPGAVGRVVIDDHHVIAVPRENRAHESRQVLALVIGRDDDLHSHARNRPGRYERLSNRSAEICSDTSPTRKMTTDSTIRSTDEFVTCDWVRIVQTA